MRTGMLLLLTLFTAVDVFSQVKTLSPSAPPSEKVIKCFTHEALEQFLKTHPNAENEAQFESWMKRKIAEKKARRDPQTLATVTLPVVFHIIHNGEAEGSGLNLSIAAIHQQLMQINKDFANKSNSIYGVAADIEIQFALAGEDPGGTALAQPGIHRVNRNTMGWTAPPYTVGAVSASNNYLNNTIKPATIWDPLRYINIWVAPLEQTPTGIILGIATFPGGSTLPGLPSSEGSTIAGVAVATATIGSIFAPANCNISYGRGKTLTHELGHFFGLRHIWGDAGCGTDYCNDTPIHFDANSGSPVHPKPNSCGTADEMFENFMDYSDDVVLNTFTENQKDRVEVVMLNSPRRKELLTSTVPTVPVTGNRIKFNSCVASPSVSVTETPTVTTYPRYKEVSLPIIVEEGATGTATVNVSAGGTAVNNYHYQIMTPALNFVAGEASKSITVRIFDNAQTESDRTIVVNYTITGSGVTAGTTQQSFTINVMDDDAMNINNNLLTLLSQDFTGVTSLPAGWTTLGSSGVVNQWRFGNTGSAGGTGNCAYISNGTAAPFPYEYDNSADGVSVLVAPAIGPGYYDMSVSFKYRIWGEIFQGEIFDYGQLLYARPTSLTTLFAINSSAAGRWAGTTGTISGNPAIALPKPNFDNTPFRLAWWWENDAIDGNNPPLAIDDIEVTGYGTRIETVAASSPTYDVRSGSVNNHFRSALNKIIASVNNASENITALTASLTGTGNGTTAITSAAGSFQRTQKVFQLSTAAPNTTTNHSITLYFTTAELAAWGADRLNLKILKVNDGVALNSVLNTTNAVVVTPSNVAENASAGYIAYTGNFTGFSQFMLVSPNFALPEPQLIFTADGEGSAIVLKWSTAQEFNNKGFGIERSINGTDFTSIGFVEGKGNSTVKTDYTYSDLFVQPNTIYYYRLVQTDMGGRETRSSIRQASIDQTDLRVIISPNPARSFVNVFIAGYQQRVDIDVINAQGQVVQRHRGMNASSTPLPLQVAGLARGMYTIAIQLEKERIVKQVILR